MKTLFLYWSIPALFVVICTFLLLMRKSKWKKPSLYGILAFVLFLILGGFSILQSRSSTAGIGFIFLPILALIPAGLAFVLGNIHTKYLHQMQSGQSVAIQKSGLIVFSLLVIAPFAWQMSVTFNTISTNKERDIERVRQKEAIKNNTKSLDTLLSENPGREIEILKGKANATEDRTELIPIAKNRHAPAELLDTLSRSVDFGVVLSVVRNRNTAEKTLEWIYINHTYPSYFYADLSSNPNTPKAILRELYEKRNQNTGIALQLARNSELPKDVLKKLTHEPRKYVLRDILNRSDITCVQVNNVITTIKKLNDTNIDWLIDMSKNSMKDCI